MAIHRKVRQVNRRWWQLSSVTEYIVVLALEITFIASDKEGGIRTCGPIRKDNKEMVQKIMDQV